MIGEVTSTSNATTPLESLDGNLTNMTSTVTPTASPSPFFTPGGNTWGESNPLSMSNNSSSLKSGQDSPRKVREGMVDLPGGVRSGSNLVVRFQSPTSAQDETLNQPSPSNSLTMVKNDGSFFVQAVHGQNDGTNVRYLRSLGQNSDDPSSVDLENPSFLSSGDQLQKISNCA